MKSFSLSELNRHPGENVDAALAGPVSLTKHNQLRLAVFGQADRRSQRRIDDFAGMAVEFRERE